MLSFSKAALLTNSTALLTAWVVIDDCGVMTWLTIAHILLLLYILNMNLAATSFRSKCEIICLKIEKSSFSNLSFQISSIFLFAFSVWSIRKKIEEKHYSCTLEEVVGNLKKKQTSKFFSPQKSTLAYNWITQSTLNLYLCVIVCAFLHCGWQICVLGCLPVKVLFTKYSKHWSF